MRFEFVGGSDRPNKALNHQAIRHPANSTPAAITKRQTIKAPALSPELPENGKPKKKRTARSRGRLPKFDSCKPDFVPPTRADLDGHFSNATNTRGLARSSLTGPPGRPPVPLLCLAPHGVFRAPSIAVRAVGSYPAISPLPPAAEASKGGIFSATLSVDVRFRETPPVHSTRHAAIWCPDFPPEPTEASSSDRPLSSVRIPLNRKSRTEKTKFACYHNLLCQVSSEPRSIHNALSKMQLLGRQGD